MNNRASLPLIVLVSSFLLNSFGSVSAFDFAGRGGSKFGGDSTTSTSQASSTTGQGGNYLANLRGNQSGTNTALGTTSTNTKLCVQLCNKASETFSFTISTYDYSTDTTTASCGITINKNQKADSDVCCDATTAGTIDDSNTEWKLTLTTPYPTNECIATLKMYTNGSQYKSMGKFVHKNLYHHSCNKCGLTHQESNGSCCTHQTTNIGCTSSTPIFEHIHVGTTYCEGFSVQWSEPNSCHGHLYNCDKYTSGSDSNCDSTDTCSWVN